MISLVVETRPYLQPIFLGMVSVPTKKVMTGGWGISKNSSAITSRGHHHHVMVRGRGESFRLANDGEILEIIGFTTSIIRRTKALR